MILTVTTIKGGAGKTTTAAAIAQAAQSKGKKVLAVDLEPQGNLSYFLGVQQGLGTYNIIEHGEPANKQVVAGPQGIDVIPACQELTTIRADYNSAGRLRKALERIRSKYDLIIIDTPPGIGELVYNGIQAADMVLIPITAEVGGVQGFQQAVNIAVDIKEDIKVSAFMAKYDKRPRINRSFKELAEKQAEAMEVDLLGVVRPGSAIVEAQALQKSLYEYAPHSNPAADYMAIYELLEDMDK